VLFVVTLATLSVAGFGFWEGARSEAILEDANGAVGMGTWLALLAGGLPYALWVVAILGAHEMGHYLACRHYGIPATPPFFIPGIPPIGTFGAVIRIRGRIPDRNALFDVAAAGPIAGFVVAVPALLLGVARSLPFDMSAVAEGETLYLFGQPSLLHLVRGWLAPHDGDLTMNSLWAAGWVGLLVTALNLFPVGQLDGGHIVYALSRRLHRVLSRLTLFGMAALIVTQLAQGEVPAYLVWFVILAWMRDRHPPLLDESSPLSPGRRRLAWVLLVIFLLAFSVAPITIIEG